MKDIQSPNLPGNGRIPPGPEDECRTADNLLGWMDDQFKRFGDIYKGSVYGTNVYVIRDPRLAHHVIVENCQNYVKEQLIKRMYPQIKTAGKSLLGSDAKPMCDCLACPFEKSA